MKPRYHDIPEELRALPNWVVWRLEERVNRKGEVFKTKVPYGAKSGRHAKSNQANTWTGFGDATEALKRGYDGLGLCLSRPYVGVDLDGCRPRGIDEPWAEQILGELDSYTELSPSHTGVHSIVKGELPDGPRQVDFGDRPHHGCGLYDAARGRYLCMTGERLRGAATIPERTAELRRIHARLFPASPPKTKTKAKAGASLADDDLIARALQANDGGKFSRLWNGHWEGDYPSQSESDLALCSKLSFWTNRDPGRIDQLFRRSALMREKWNRQDYREATIAKAIDQTTETYRPRGADRRNPGVTEIRVDALAPSLETLNALNIFGGRISFTLLRRRIY
jgi:primase-polymerase (primpol)-like protein